MEEFGGFPVEPVSAFPLGERAVPGRVVIQRTMSLSHSAPDVASSRVFFSLFTGPYE